MVEAEGRRWKLVEAVGRRWKLVEGVAVGSGWRRWWSWVAVVVAQMS